ncbi:protein kinase [uncultured Microscilla sp.]|uniref:serine/threonine protein kinase n=1 Tax=uncultured Microscilla sp. TaxID=432653 RepID=UPI002602D762|nr:protein kinase [uncultured Microscilla sp.]
MKNLKQRVSSNDLDIACRILDDAFFDTVEELRNEYLNLRARIKENKSNELGRVATSENIELEKNLLRRTTLKLCDDIEGFARNNFAYLFRISSKSLEKQLKLKLAAHYEVKDPINGNSAVFYHGTELNSNRRIIIRALKKYEFGPVDKETQTASKRARDARIDRILNFKHRNIIKILGTHLDSFPQCLILEYVDGISLQSILRVLPLTRVSAIEMAIQLADAIDYLHTHGEIHQRIRSSKILIDNELKPIISPFELLDNVKTPQEGEHFLADLHYAAPEALADMRNATEKSDQFSLGAVIFEMLTGTPLFRPLSRGKASLQEVFQHRLHFFNVQKVNQQVLAQIEDTKLRSVLKKMLAYHPNDRYFSMGEVKHELQAIHLHKNKSIDLALASYRRCCIRNPEFFNHFYEALFAHPALGEQIKAYFTAPEVVDNDRNRKRKLRNALLLLLGNIEHSSIYGHISQIKGHNKLGMEFYEAFMDQLIITVAKNDYLWQKYETASNPALQDAWAAVKNRTLEGLRAVLGG